MQVKVDSPSLVFVVVTFPFFLACSFWKQKKGEKHLVLGTFSQPHSVLDHVVIVGVQVNKLQHYEDVV